MSYRGQDLDLRTPQSWSAAAHEAPGWIAGDAIDTPPRGRGGLALRNGPIWVDDTVLSCCNHAFDLAVAHRSAEVRIEHLLHALTRLDAAAEVLESHGVRVASLRRETGAAITGDIPAGLSPGGMPRRSDELEDVLRRASAQAERRYAAAGVDEMLGALFDSKTDMPGVSLLHRNAARPVRELPEPFVAFRRLPPAGSGSGFAHATNGDGENGGVGLQILERVQRLEAGLEKRLGELARTWSLFAERLNSLEHAVLGPRPGEESDIASVHERIGQLEQSLLTGLTEAGRSWGGIADRLKAMEGMLGERTDDAGIAPLVERLDAIKEASAAQRLQAMEAHASLAAEVKALAGALTTQASGNDQVRSSVADLVQKLDAALSESDGNGDGQEGKAIDGVMERLSAVLAAFESLAAKQQAADAAHAKELGEVHEALLKLNVNQHTLAGSIEQWRTDAADDVGLIGNRLEVLERETVKPVAMLEDVSSAVDAIHRLTVAKQDRRNRFWYWLFGTEDWVSASWPSQAAFRKARSFMKKAGT